MQLTESQESNSCLTHSPSLALMVAVITVIITDCRCVAFSQSFPTQFHPACLVPGDGESRHLGADERVRASGGMGGKILFEMYKYHLSRVKNVLIIVFLSALFCQFSKNVHNIFIFMCYLFEKSTCL